VHIKAAASVSMPTSTAQDFAGIISKVLFLWVQPMMRAGFQRPLREDDAIDLPKRVSPAALQLRFKELWTAEVTTAIGPKGPSLLRVLRKLVGKDFYIALCVQVFTVMLKFGSIALLRRLVQLISSGAEKRDGLLCALALFIFSVMEGLLASLATFHIQLCLYSCMACIGQSVLQKGSRLHPDLQGKFPRGALVTLALSDFGRIVDMSGILMQGIGAPFMLMFAFVFLVSLLGPMVLVDLLVVALVGFAILRTGKLQGASFRGKMMWQGKRVGILNEMLQSVRFTKYYVLEEHYQKQMMKTRQNEEVQLSWMKVALALNWPIAALVPCLTVILVFSLHVALFDEMPSKADTLAILAIARFLFLPFAFFGGFLGCANMFFSATGRLRTLLLQEEIRRAVLPQNADAEKPALQIRNQSFSWSLDASIPPTLTSINMTVGTGQLVAIVGELGSGKSSLLQAVMGNIGTVNIDDGSQAVPVEVCGTSRTYVAQEPMVMNATVKDNIIFGFEHSWDADQFEKAYQNAIEAAALEPDLATLPAGDQTEIGEKGITLSGGQKARVALARAVFANKPGCVVLLDDPLSAVDAHVGAHIFDKCIVETLAGSTRLLVTNQLHFLNHSAVAHVFVMDSGRIAEHGTFQELSADPSSRLSNMLASLGGAARERDKLEEKVGDVQLATRKTMVDDAPANMGQGQLVKKETKKEGAVTTKTFRFYFTALGGWGVMMCLAMSSWLFHLSELIPDLYLVAWQEDMFEASDQWYLVRWIAISSVGVLGLFFARFIWVKYTLGAARNIHANVVGRVLHCPMSYFDQTPSGRIVNRLGEDQLIVDFTVAINLEVLCITFWQVLDQVSLAIFARPLVGPFVICFFAIFMMIREVHRRTSRETIRWYMVTKSPLFTIFEETLSGLTTIHAFGQEGRFFQRFEQALEENLKWLLAKDSSNLWTDQRHCFIGSLLVGTLAVQMVSMPDTESTTLGAVALIYAFQLGFSLKTVSYFLVQVEGSFASVERIQEFTQELAQEPAFKLASDENLAKAAWPGDNCFVEFVKVCVKYAPHLPRALDGVTAKFFAMENVGIIGRTGSGKSTVMGALFRLFELEEGTILLGGTDIAKVGVGFLRKQITIVPQDPILFSGELRKNLDPIGTQSDAMLWSALERCSLNLLVKELEGQLGANVAEGGSNFSVGERQVLCLARALLRDARVLCLDEATANVDPTNDKRIQEVLTREFTKCSVLTIAHRLHTVMASDRIMVLDKGKLAQLDTPVNLIAQPGIFRELATQAGIGPESIPGTAPSPSAGTSSLVRKEDASHVGVPALAEEDVGKRYIQL